MMDKPREVLPEGQCLSGQRFLTVGGEGGVRSAWEGRGQRPAQGCTETRPAPGQVLGGGGERGVRIWAEGQEASGRRRPLRGLNTGMMCESGKSLGRGRD